MATVVVPLTILMAFEDGTINKVRPKVSFISYISSSIIVVLNTLSILSVRKVILIGSVRKSSPSVPLGNIKIFQYKL